MDLPGTSNQPTPPSRPNLGIRKKITFSLLIVTGALIGLELAARAITEISPNARWEYNRKLAVTLGFPALNDLFLADPVLFWKLKPSLEGHRLEGRFANAPPMSFSVSTDNNGYRRMPELPHAQYTVLCLGDSCTFGLGVDDSQTFPAVLQRRMTGVRFLNRGIPGYTSFQGRLLLEQLEETPTPSVILICFGRNDDLAWDSKSDLEHARIIEEERNRLLDRLQSVQLLKRLLPEPAAKVKPKPANARPRLNMKEFEEQVRAMLTWCEIRGAAPILIIWPQRWQMDRAGVTPKQLVMAQLAREKDIPLVNLLPVFRNNGGQTLFLDVVHANARGCQLTANALHPVIQQALDNRASASN